MELILVLLEYVYIPMAVALYFLHIKVVKIEANTHDNAQMRLDIQDIKKDLHHLILVEKAKHE